MINLSTFRPLNHGSVMCGPVILVRLKRTDNRHDISQKTEKQYFLPKVNLNQTSAMCPVYCGVPYDENGVLVCEVQM